MTGIGLNPESELFGATSSRRAEDRAGPREVLGDWQFVHGWDAATESLAKHDAGDAAKAPDPGPMADFPAVIDLGNLDSEAGFIVRGGESLDRLGESVSDAGDINGDGFADIIVGAPGVDDGGRYSGASYVIFGRGDGFANIDVAVLDPADGFVVEGAARYDRAGASVSAAGDVNGDGFDDIIVGAREDANRSGVAYVIFGKAGGFGVPDEDGRNVVDLSRFKLRPDEGFRIKGDQIFDYAGYSVSGEGDVNGDGFDDMLVGSRRNGAFGDSPGDCYVIFGKAGGFSTIDVTDLAPSEGFAIHGDMLLDYAGSSVSSAGDINGDGLDDIIVGARYGDDGGNSAGEAYVIFGQTGGFTDIDLTGLASRPDEGFIIQGDSKYDRLGVGVSSAGDVDGDGFDDIIVGAPGDNGGGGGSGVAYVIFGHAGAFGTIDLTTLASRPELGFIILGDEKNDSAGWSVSGAGDVNGDGFDDVLIGAFEGDDGGPDAGQAYLIFGGAGGFGTIDLGALAPDQGFVIQGDAPDDEAGGSVSGAGDIDGDGFDDLIVGARFGGDVGGFGEGAAYVIFGRAPTEAVRRIGSEADQTIRGGDFDDTLRGEGGSDSLIGADGADMIEGGKGVDLLVGAHGDDTLRGGGGRDNLIGGEGADRIVAPGSFDRAAADVIYGFETGVDEIVLDGTAFGLAPGALDTDSFVVSNQARDAEDRLIYKADSGKLYFDPDGADGQAQVLVATLVGAPAIGAGDFIVV